jgi:hypothetical protein
MAERLPKIQAIKQSNGEVLFHFDPAKVPSRGARLSAKLRFAEAYIEGFMNGRFATVSTLKLCVKWIGQAAKELD